MGTSSVQWFIWQWEGSVCMCARVCSCVPGHGGREAQRPQEVSRSLKISAKFQLGFPKSSTVKMSSYLIAVTLAHSLKNKLIDCLVLRGQLAPVPS